MQESFRRRRLPHLDLPGATYFVTSCVAGSIPSRGLLDVTRYRRSLEQRPRPNAQSTSDWIAHKWKLTFVRVEQWLDCQPAVQHLSDPPLASEVAKAIYHFAGERYDLLAYVVMPGHLHWVFRPVENWVSDLGESVDERTPRERILHSMKRFTGRQCNLLRGAQGAFWQDESYDHCVRDEDELERTGDYIELNPVRAGLVNSREDWKFSSARDRIELGTRIGEPLVRRGAGL